MYARDIMTHDPIYGDSRTTVKSAMKLMWDNDIRHLPMLDDAHQLVAILSERDLRSSLWFYAGVSGEPFEEPALTLAIRSPLNIQSDTPVKQVIDKMLVSGCRVLHVVNSPDDLSLVGIVSYVAVLRVVSDQQRL